MLKTPQEMVEFWEEELAKIDKEEALEGIALWSRHFVKAKIEIWQEVVDVQERINQSRTQEAER